METPFTNPFLLPSNPPSAPEPESKRWFEIPRSQAVVTTDVQSVNDFWQSLMQPTQALFVEDLQGEDPLPELVPIGVADDIARFRTLYGDATCQQLLQSGLPDAMIHEALHLLTTTDLMPEAAELEGMDAIDFKNMIRQMVKAYRLIQPATVDEKVEQLMAVFGIEGENNELRRRIRQTQIRNAARIMNVPLNTPESKVVDTDEGNFELSDELKARVPEWVDASILQRFEQDFLDENTDFSKSIRVIEQVAEKQLTKDEVKSLTICLARAKGLIEAACVPGARSEEAYQHIHVEHESIRRQQRESHIIAQLTDGYDGLQRIVNAQEISVSHEGFKRSRRIPPFLSVLKKKLCVPLLGFAAQLVHMEDFTDLSPVLANKIPASSSIRQGLELFERHLAIQLANLIGECLKQYAELYQAPSDATPTPQTPHPTPMGALTGFVGWLRDEARNSYGADIRPSGEFHVGRDTLTTTHVLRQAQVWGKLPAVERRKKILHVDVSRTLVTNTPRAILAAYLRQNGVTSQMLGIDGGFRGTGPQDALLAVMDPVERQYIIQNSPPVSLSKIKPLLDPRIRLMEANPGAAQRTFDYPGKYKDVVPWMEGLPKFTERSQFLVRSVGTDGKFFIATHTRDASEQLLAWTVQHAMWRELIPKK